MFGMNIEELKTQVIAALLTIAFVNNRKEETVGIDTIWSIYEKFLNKQEQYVVSKEDFKKIAATLKEAGLWK